MRTAIKPQTGTDLIPALTGRLQKPAEEPVEPATASAPEAIQEPGNTNTVEDAGTTPSPEVPNTTEDAADPGQSDTTKDAGEGHGDAAQEDLSGFSFYQEPNPLRNGYVDEKLFAIARNYQKKRAKFINEAIDMFMKEDHKLLLNAGHELKTRIKQFRGVSVSGRVKLTSSQKVDAEVTYLLAHGAHGVTPSNLIGACVLLYAKHLKLVD